MDEVRMWTKLDEMDKVKIMKNIENGQNEKYWIIKNRQIEKMDNNKNGRNGRNWNKEKIRFWTRLKMMYKLQ